MSPCTRFECTYMHVASVHWYSINSNVNGFLISVQHSDRLANQEQHIIYVCGTLFKWHTSEYPGECRGVHVCLMMISVNREDGDQQHTRTTKKSTTYHWSSFLSNQCSTVVNYMNRIRLMCIFSAHLRFELNGELSINMVRVVYP